MVVPGNIVDEQGSDGTAVVGAGDGPEIFLASSIPDLQFDGFLAHLNDLRAKFNSNSSVMVIFELVVEKLQYDGGLPNG